MNRGADLILSEKFAPAGLSSIRQQSDLQFYQ